MKRRFALIAPLVLLLSIPLAEAEKMTFEHNYPVVADRWGVDLGGFLVDLDTNASVGFGRFVGTTIDLEDLLDLDETQSVGRLEGFYRIKPKHELDFGVLRIDRSASTSINTPIDFDQYRFTGDLSSTFDMLQFQVTYRYSFLNNGQVNAGISTGLSWFDLEASLEGGATLLDDAGMPVGSTSFETVGETLLAPVPSLGMFLDYAPAKWFLLRLSGQFFDVDAGDVDFKFSDTRLVMDFFFTKNVGIGIGVNTVELKYVDSGEDPFSIEYGYGGILYHLSLTF